jgi:hypothetical protein
MSSYKLIPLFYFIIILQNINTSKLRKTKNGDENCQVNPNSGYCKAQKYRLILMLIFAILVLISFIILLICCLRRMRNIGEIRRLRGNVIGIRSNDELEQEIMFKKKIFYIFTNEIKPQKYYPEKPGLEDTCPVCLEKFDEKKQICITPCKHIYHYNCIYDYVLNTKDTLCPLCKFDYLNIVKDKNIDFNKIDFNIIKVSNTNNSSNGENIVEENNNNRNNYLSLRVNAVFYGV